MNHSNAMPMTNIMPTEKEHSKSAYKKLFGIGVFHFVAMYAVMYTMVDRASDIFLNVNNLYMTGMMLAPMMLVMPLTMAMMYPNKKLNALIIGGSSIVFVTFYIFMRAQTFVGDKEFLKSMIPHHSGAILMCDKAKISDGELKNLCQQIIKGQQSEIDQMKKILDRI
jgi:uncharacterized protein (DUF305 family)